MTKKFLNLLVIVSMLAITAPVVIAAPPVQDGGQDYVVVNDDWLSKLAEKYLGNLLAYPAIMELTNQKAAQDSSYATITNPDLIEVGWKIYIPSAAEAEAYLAVPVPGAEPGEEVTLVFSDWHLTEPHWEKSLKEAFETYGALHPNITLELDYVSYGDKDTKYATEIQAGAGPDVIHLHAYSLRSFIERGFLLDLTPFIEAEGGDAFLAPWYPQTLAMMQYEGSYFAIPGDFMSMALFYNTNLYQEAGLDPTKPPATWDEFLANAQALTRDKDGDGQVDTWGFGTIGAVDPGFELRVSPILFSHGGDYLNEDYTCSALNTPQAKEAFAYFTGLFTEHEVIPPGVTAQNPGTVREQMANEQIAMLLGSGWTAPIVASVNPDLNAFEVLEVADVPIKAGTDPDFTTTAWLSAWAINPNTEHPQEAWELIKFITAKEQEQKWFEDARVTSARSDVSEEYQPLVTDKFAKAIAGQLPKAKFVPQIKEWPQVIEAVNTAAQLAFTGDKTPEEALEDAHNQINEILGGTGCPGF
ncbi:MAG: extracellular solute-binding protein [Anaerolineales bacterium]|nr:MAG: extracellular solute-binding protein [Anaerolineales bacterium]